eukprot:5643070-Pleurochrysis_carterae.AAC.8
MNNKQNTEGVKQAEKGIRAIERSREGHMNVSNRGEEELALRQLITGIIPKWQENDEKEKKIRTATMTRWTGKMMSMARVQMNKWTKKKNEHTARVQRRWYNKGIMKEAFRKWKATAEYGSNTIIRGR